VIILDTNVVSEMMRANPDASVLGWLDAQPAEAMYLTSITLAELHFGVAAMPASRRRDRLDGFVAGLEARMQERTLPFDAKAARHHARLAVLARRRGRGFPLPDAYIAGIADARGFAIATRDTAPFRAVGLEVINPWHNQGTAAG
jgi:predicted nucleic acid-binding protein